MPAIRETQQFVAGLLVAVAVGEDRKRDNQGHIHPRRAKGLPILPVPDVHILHRHHHLQLKVPRPAAADGLLADPVDHRVVGRGVAEVDSVIDMK